MLRVTERQPDRKVTSTGPGDQLGVLEVGMGGMPEPFFAAGGNPGGGTG